MSCGRNGKSCKTGVPRGEPNDKSARRLRIRIHNFDAHPPIGVRSPKRPGSLKKVC